MCRQGDIGWRAWSRFRDDVLSEPLVRKRDHEPTDQDDRELLLDDPALPEIAIDDDVSAG